MFKNVFVLASLSLTGLVAAQGGIAEIGTLYSYTPQATALACGASCLSNNGHIAVSQSFLTEFGCGHPTRVWNPAHNLTEVVPICDACPPSLCPGTTDFAANPAVLAVLGYPGAASVPGAEWDP
ncbi:hypothetical protein BOTBODRAFT_50936 [Botryobasidium botryosum FD-172 SS1]|uniref:RlpA-like protein double-psi beta-barrel domain-containing protein n=1 Tax=Botryobasidium botryosum (strain FD-172 SS1) TaxID=930990 RepID=A0A067MZ72_BOTB1|nr:hypothetical protein BOTBODRAFT_50936 [Botryobasidium botryosum FD-172 SS1]